MKNPLVKNILIVTGIVVGVIVLVFRVNPFGVKKALTGKAD
jgi:hypothetical protein